MRRKLSTLKNLRLGHRRERREIFLYFPSRVSIDVIYVETYGCLYVNREANTGFIALI
jgi:hypothetical protein